METISQKWVNFAYDLKYEHIPRDAVREAKRLLLDSLGCAYAALCERSNISMLEYIKGLTDRKHATVIGYGEKSSLPLATLMNSLLIRSLDYNDVYWDRDPSHPSDVIPAVLSGAEFRRRSAKDVLVGIVVAYELETRICSAAFPGVREVGWHHATLTQFVSPVVASLMLGLSREKAVWAVGISGTSHYTVGGVVAGRLSNMKNAADPFAVEAGVRAALMARNGFSGPEDVFEGKEQLFHVIYGVEWEVEKLTEGLGKEFYITKCSYKPFPTEALTHQPITAVLEIVKENDIGPDDIDEVLIETTTRGADILSDSSKYRPTTKETADHSLPYCVAVAVVRRRVLPSDFDEASLNDGSIRNMLPKVKVVANREIDKLFPSVKRAVAHIITKDGRKFSKTVDYARGQPEKPLGDEELIEKFKANVSDRLTDSEMDQIVDAVFNIEKFSDFRDFMNMLKSSG